MNASIAAQQASARAACSAAPLLRQRILMTADIAGATWPYALELGCALIAGGHEVALATTGGMPDREQRREAAAIAGLELYPSTYKSSMPEGCADRPAAGRWLLTLADSIRPSVLHLNGFDHADLPWKVPLLVAAHVCMHSWWRAVHGTPAPASWRDYRELVAAGLKMADLVVAPTRATLHELQQQHGPLRAARVIPHGRSAADAQVQAKGDYVFSSGCIGDRGQNFAALAAAAANVPRPVYVASLGESPDHVADAMPGVRVLGRLARGDAARWLARAAIYALPARHAPAGLSIHDAALARCALVLGDVDALREIWDGAAIFVDPNDAAALAHALQRLIADTDLRQRYSQLAFQRARRFTPAAMAAAYAAAYAEIALPECGDVEYAAAARAPMHC